MKALYAVLLLIVAGAMCGCNGDNKETAEPSQPVAEKKDDKSPGVAYRRSTTPFDAVDLSPEQEKRIEEITAEYMAKFAKLGYADEQELNDRRDLLNQEYSKAVMAEMTSEQKEVYLEAVYLHVMDFLETHPEFKFEDVFVIGGAYAKKPED